LFAVDISIGVESIKDVVATNDDVLESVACVDGDALILAYLHNVSSLLKIVSLTDGAERGVLVRCFVVVLLLLFFKCDNDIFC
jgi:hypothetical protein